MRKPALRWLSRRGDPAKAKALLSEAGYANGFEVDFTGPIGRWPNSDQVMQAVAGFAKGLAPLTAVEIARRSLDSAVQPGGPELETAVKGLGTGK